MRRASPIAILLAALTLLSLAAPAASASGTCVRAGYDEAPWDNWIVVWACASAPAFTGRTCSGAGLFWFCVGENASGDTTGGVWIEGLVENVSLA